MRGLPYAEAKPLVLVEVTSEPEGIRELLIRLSQKHRRHVSYYMARKILLEADEAGTVERVMNPGHCINHDSWRRIGVA